jgi:hypothetical protein
MSAKWWRTSALVWFLVLGTVWLYQVWLGANQTDVVCLGVHPSCLEYVRQLRQADGPGPAIPLLAGTVVLLLLSVRANRLRVP